MPAPELDYRFQRAQLWERIGDDEHANPIISTRVELKVRWENKQIEMLTPSGQPIKIDALVIVVRDIKVGSIMWEGCEDDLPDDLSTITKLMEVVAFDNIPDVKGRIQRRTVGLKRYNDKIPEIR